MYLLILVLFQALLLNVNLVFAENYYISNQGNDRNDGLSPVFPWKTIDKLNSFMPNLKPGDAVFFERGGYFSGQINLNASGDRTYPFVIGAYGEGSNPVISGAVPVKNWTVYKDGIYKAEVNFEVKNLFVNGKQMTLARYPNKGMLTVTKSLSDPNSGFTDKHLKQPNGYWNGSNARIRTENWAYEHSAIKNYFKGTIALTKPTFYPINAGWGYYLDNNINELDTLNEWYFEKTGREGGIIYYQPSKFQSIDNLIIEVCIFDYAIFTKQNLQNVTIQDVDIKYQYSNGIWFTGNKDNIVINNCRFIGQVQIGIYFTNYSRNCKINNCRFYNINGKALYILKSFETIISNNIFTNIGMISGYGTTGDAFGMSGIVILDSDSNHIFKNFFFNIGHDGINSIGMRNVVEKNVIMNSMLLLNDGSAIKCYGNNSSHSVWKNNFIFNCPGNLDGTYINYNHIAASGIYLDNKTNNMEVYGNTIEGCGLSGINLNNGCVNNKIYDNLCYSNGFGINFYQGIFAMKNNLIRNNIFCGVNNSQYSVQVFLTSGVFNPGLFQSNYFINSVFAEQFIIQNRGVKEIINFSQWKKFIKQGEEFNSILLTGNVFNYSKVFYNMSDDSISYILEDKYMFKDISNNSVYGTLSISPWSSELLFSEKDNDFMPSLNVINGPLYFGNMMPGKYSTPQWFCLKGVNISEPVMIIAPDGFKLSLFESDNYVKSLTIRPEKNNIFNVIFVKFTPESENNFYNYIKINSGNLNHSVKVTGNSRK